MPTQNNRRTSGQSNRRGRSTGAHRRGPRRYGRSNGRRRDTRTKRQQPTFDPTQFINKNPIQIEEEVYVPTHTFADFAIDTKLKETIATLGLETPSPIQDQTIPHILAGKDVIGLAETGTGKTAAFLLPLIQQKLTNQSKQTLILTPTRELALQVDAELKKLSGTTRMFSTVCVGGTGIGPQIKGLRRKNHFVIGTPGRIKDLQDRGILRPQHIDSVVLDEADRMLDMGFINDMRAILGQLTTDRQTLLFSATMDDKAKSLVHDFMIEPITVSVKKKDVTDSIEQDVVRYQNAHKFELLHMLLQKPDFKRVIIFGAMKHSVEKLAKELARNGITAESIHGNKSHSQRQRSLNRFKSGQAQVLVATDVAARGIHVDNVSHVINYDLPNTFADYVHRIGRTGRGTKHGKALTFVSETT